MWNNFWWQMWNQVLMTNVNTRCTRQHLAATPATNLWAHQGWACTPCSTLRADLSSSANSSPMKGRSRWHTSTVLPGQGRELQIFWRGTESEHLVIFSSRFKCRISAKALCLNREKREFQLVTFYLSFYLISRFFRLWFLLRLFLCSAGDLFWEAQG